MGRLRATWRKRGPEIHAIAGETPAAREAKRTDIAGESSTARATDARRSSGTPDALFRRTILCGEISQ
jgi:hypothetical protein